MDNGFVPISLMILALALLGVMTLGVLAWKALNFAKSLLAPAAAPELEQAPVRRAKPVKEEPMELPEGSAQSITDRMVRKNWK